MSGQTVRLSRALRRLLDASVGVELPRDNEARLEARAALASVEGAVQTYPYIFHDDCGVWVQAAEDHEPAGPYPDEGAAEAEVEAIVRSYKERNR